MESNDLLFWPQHDHGAEHLFWDPAGDSVLFWGHVTYLAAGGLVISGAGTVRVSLAGEAHVTGAGGLVLGGSGQVRFSPGRLPVGWGSAAWPSVLVAVHAVGEGGLVIGGQGRWRVRRAAAPVEPRPMRQRWTGAGGLLVGGSGMARGRNYAAEVTVPEDEELLTV